MTLASRPPFGYCPAWLQRVGNQTEPLQNYHARRYYTCGLANGCVGINLFLEQWYAFGSPSSYQWWSFAMTVSNSTLEEEKLQKPSAGQGWDYATSQTGQKKRVCVLRRVNFPFKTAATYNESCSK